MILELLIVDGKYINLSMTIRIIFLCFSAIFPLCSLGAITADFVSSPQYGKSLALFGGSFTVKKEASIAIDYWCECLNLQLTNYGSNGAGFSYLTKSPCIQTQVDSACSPISPKYDIYLFWASTNDFHFANGRAGTVEDYTDNDFYDENKLETQCGGINYCFRKVKEKNPGALVLFFTSIGDFRYIADGKGTSPCYDGIDGMNHFVNLQMQICERWGVPYLNQFNEIINEGNWQSYVESDHLHLNASGYIAIREEQMRFIAYPQKRTSSGIYIESYHKSTAKKYRLDGVQMSGSLLPWYGGKKYIGKAE